MVFSFYVNAQTKKPATTTTKKTTTTTKKPAVKTTTTTKTTVTKPATTTTTTTPAAKPAAVVNTPAPIEEVKQSAGPPVTGPVKEGPKSYTTDGTNTNTINTTTKTTTKTTTTKTVAPKPEKAKANNGETVRSYFGIRGGYNLGKVQDALKEVAAVSTTAKEKFEPGYMGGLVLNLGISKSFSIQPEILYSQQGFRLEDGADYLSGKTDIVNVPLLLKLAVGSPNVKFFINAGPYIGYKLSQTADVNFGGFVLNGKQDFTTEYDTDGTKDNRFDFGGIGGAGFQFSLGGPLLVLEGRYQYGMADPTLYKDGKKEEIGSLGHTRVITGTVGLLFPLGGK